MSVHVMCAPLYLDPHFCFHIASHIKLFIENFNKQSSFLVLPFSIDLGYDSFRFHDCSVRSDMKQEARITIRHIVCTLFYFFRVKFLQ